MPYIKKEIRKKYDKKIDKMFEILTNEHGVQPGELNYVVSKLIWNIFDYAPSYTSGNELVGVLECVKQEFIRRRLNPYENNKLMENGDLKDNGGDIPGDYSDVV